MHQEPYYDHYPKIKELSFDQFVQFSIEDYENAIAMWNQKMLAIYAWQQKCQTRL